jgi:gingipain K
MTGQEPVWVGFSAPEPGAEAEIAVPRAGTEVVEIEVELPGVRLTAAETERGPMTRVEIPGLGRIGDTGAPMLPVLRRFVEIPEGAQASFEVMVLEHETINLAEHGMPQTIYPVQLPRPKCDCDEARAWRFSFKPDAYQHRVGHPPVSATGPFTFRDHRVMLMAVAPVTYDPAQGRLEVATRLRVLVQMSGGDLALTRARKQRLASRHFDAFLLGSTLNLNFGGEAAGWAYPDDAPIEYLIVTPPQFTGDLQPFVDWKTSCGYRVTVATTDVTGTLADDIKAYISGLYGSASPPVYILMIGDSPTPLVTYEVVSGGAGGTDLPYVQMDGDLYPDMMISRWPIDDSSELIAMRDKILFYEQPTAGSSAWLDRALFLGGDDYASHGMTTHQDIIAELMEPLPNGAECAYWDGEATDPTTAELIADLNTGRGWAVYSAHSGPGGWSGDPPLSSGDIASFGNTNMYPLAHGHSCQSNMWNDYGDVFGEVTVTTADKGFVSYWGGSNNTYWDEDDWLERGFFDSMFDTHLTGNLITLTRQYSNVAACYSGLTEVTLQGGNEHYYWHCYNLDGDPSLDPFTRQPLAMSVGVPVAVPPVATATFAVTVTDAAVGGVPGALVGVTQGGVLLGAGFTDATGSASFHIDAPAPGSDLQVRVTAHNHLPTDASVVVAAGSDGLVIFDAAVYSCSSTVQIQVFDADLDTDPTVPVTVSAVPFGGTITVDLVRVPGSVVRFTGSVVLGTDLTLSHGQKTLVVTYHDADTGSGSGADKTDVAVADCAGPVIQSITTSVTHDTISLSWVTSEPATTRVVYGTSGPPALIAEDTGLVTDHSLTLSGLDPCTRYFYRIEGVDALGNLGSDPAGSYTWIDTHAWVPVLATSLDSDPGWVIYNGGNSNGWAFGVPSGGGGQYGSPDPTAGATGSKVYGVNLDGDYDGSLTHNQLQLLTPSLDLSQAETVLLIYQRWLGVESPTFDHARVTVSVDDGSWITVWENEATMDGGSWVEESLDLTAIAAGSSNVKVRWSLGSTSGAGNYCGWNIDDITVAATMACATTGIFADGFESGDTSSWSAVAD